MDEVESTFTKLRGLQTAEKEVERLYRVKNALGIRENDALFGVLMALETYDTLFSQYPARISGEMSRLMAEQREHLERCTALEARRAITGLTDAVVETSTRIADSRARGGLIVAVGWCFVAAVLYGALMLSVGVVLGSGRIPYWAGTDLGASAMAKFLGILARTPAGVVVAVAGTAVAGITAWHSREEMLAGRRLRLAAGCAALFGFSLLLLWPVF